MKASGLVLTMAAVFVLIPAAPGLVPAQPIEGLAPAPCDAIAATRLLFYGDDPADLQTCERDCRDKFGLEPYSDSGTDLQFFRGGGGSGTYYAYAQCIQDCNSAFWKDFDRRARDLEKDR
jgi:hypothetical protein